MPQSEQTRDTKSETIKKKLAYSQNKIRKISKKNKKIQ